MTKVYWLSWKPGIDARGPWDTGLLEALFKDELWVTGRTFTHASVSSVDATPHERAVVILPARHYAEPADLEYLNEQLAKLAGVVLILVGDEEAIFPWRSVRHGNLRLWVMLPRPKEHGDLKGWAFFFGDGWKADTPSSLYSPEAPTKDILWSFAGQVTHPRRKRAVNGLRRAQARFPGQLLKTEGFTQGMPRWEYLDQLRRTKVAPCPGGPHTPDTFRFYEALEAGCVPLPDALSAKEWPGYWGFLFDDFPFICIDDWDNVGGFIKDNLASWPLSANLASAWWIARKREMAKRLNLDLNEIGHATEIDNMVTVVISTSPIPSHPSLEILETTLESVWASLGREVQIVIACDGVRDEQDHLRTNYDEYCRQLCWKAQHVWPNVLPVVSPQHRHQAGMCQLAMEFVDTPVILFVEHDCPIITDEPIDWTACIDLVEFGGVDVLRFHHEAMILPDHEHMMIDHQTTHMLNVPLRRTMQWSQRPHLASASYYRRILKRHFPKQAKTMIEDKMHSVAQSYPAEHRIAIYHPSETNIKRSAHLDGRAHEDKFDMRFT